MARRLSGAGYRVVACTNESDAVSELHRAPVALVLAALRMAPLSGIELTRLMRDDGALPARGSCQRSLRHHKRRRRACRGGRRSLMRGVDQDWANFP